MAEIVRLSCVSRWFSMWFIMSRTSCRLGTGVARRKAEPFRMVREEHDKGEWTLLETLFGILYVGTSAQIVKKFRPDAFRCGDGKKLATDVALTAVGAVTVAPVVVLWVVLKQFVGVAAACLAMRR